MKYFSLRNYKSNVKCVLAVCYFCYNSFPVSVNNILDSAYCLISPHKQRR